MPANSLPGGKAGAMNPIGNTRLVEYGIQNEKSDYRAHVCVIPRLVYVFKTEKGKLAVQSGRHSHRQVKTGQIVTAIGHTVPIEEIDGIFEIQIPEWVLVDIEPTDNTSVKGEKAVKVVADLIRHGMFPIDMLPDITQSLDLQISGVDIVINLNVKIQVKCDYKGGNKHFGGTGNLFLQIAECNPFKMT